MKSELFMYLPIIVFVGITLFFVFLCRQQLTNSKCHGFYRFFAFEFLLALAMININLTELNLLSFSGVFSGLLMLSSLGLVIFALRHLRSVKVKERDEMPENFSFENTERLITSGVYHYIRHPMYASLLLLGSGLFFQRPSAISLSVFVMASFLIVLTAWIEEKENMIFFGDEYREYKNNNKMFIPFFL